MDLVTVACNECGAPISVPRTTNFLTCSHCGVSLSVKHTGDASYTEVIREISERTARIEEDVAYLRVRDRLEQIDREWEREREKYMVTGQHGHRHLPTSLGAVVGIFIAVVFGVVGFLVTSATGAPAFMPLLMVLFILMGLWFAYVHLEKARAYRRAEKRYRRRRWEVERAQGESC